MSVIPESGMNFGKYDEKDLFHIETSEIYKNLEMESQQWSLS